MKINILIITLLFAITTFGQKKKECGDKLDSRINNLSGQWKFVYSDLAFTKGGKEKRSCPLHILSFDKSKFSVKHHADSLSYQNGTIKIKKDNPADKGNCEVLVYFKSKGDEPVYAWDLDTYHVFWLIDKCDADSLTLYSPWTSDLIDKKSGMVIRHYSRQK